MVVMLEGSHAGKKMCSCAMHKQHTGDHENLWTYGILYKQQGWAETRKKTTEDSY